MSRKSIFQWAVLVLVFLKIFFFLLYHRHYFLRRFDPIYFGKLYSESQYVKGQLSQGGIGDDGLYAFAGYYYFFQKGDVSAVNFEHPPLGKYLIGLSIYLFKNENVVNLLYFFFLFVVVYLLGNKLFKNNFLAVFPLLILSFDSLFLDHLIRSQLDLPFTVFFLWAVFFFLQSFQKNFFLYLSFVFWGLAFSTRFFPFFLVIYFYLAIILFLFRKFSFFTFLKSSFFPPLIYLLLHFSFFLYHPSFFEFLRHKKWMLAWFTGSPIILANIWRNILTGWYIDSTGQWVKNTHWSIVLPITIILGFFSFFLFFPQTGKKNSQNLENSISIFVLCFLYLLYLTFLTNGLQKFLMPIYPLMSILSFKGLEDLCCIINLWRKRVRF